MDDMMERKRILAVERFVKGEDPSVICTSLGRSKRWLYKWIKRYREYGESWPEEHSRRPLSNPRHIRSDIEEIVRTIRTSLFGKDLFCGAQAILWEMEDLGIVPLPSLRAINRILKRGNLVKHRKGGYKPVGTLYPVLPSLRPNQTHQADLVGPCYLKGPVRFFSLNVLDTATFRCGIHPCPSLAGQAILDGIWGIWKRMGIPERIQVDNAMSFFGSPTHPRGMGPLIRLCLNNGVEPWFIPMSEPWRNGLIESFNDRYQQMFLGKRIMSSREELETASLEFELRHNSRYRYSKLRGCTPMKALEMSRAHLRFPVEENAPVHRIKKPEIGRYHVVRLIRNDLRINIFGECFAVPPETYREYVTATIDVKEQKLKLFLDGKQIDELDYQLR